MENDNLQIYNGYRTPEQLNVNVVGVTVEKPLQLNGPIRYDQRVSFYIPEGKKKITITLIDGSILHTVADIVNGKLTICKVLYGPGNKPKLVIEPPI
jgi:hypothetical protein